jgi:quinol monooxygenase YgiN
MYAAITTIQTDPNRVDEAQAIYRDTVVPMAKQVGAKGLMLMIDRNTGKTVSIGLWETEADARNYETSGQFQQAVAAFGDLFQERPVREILEVAVRMDI